MSSTNRGSEREPSDAYFTPIDVARAIVQRLLDDNLVTRGCSVLEPSVGKGAFAVAADELLAPNELDVVDLVIQPEIKLLDVNDFQQDFLTFDQQPQRYGLILGNPPYADAERHVRHALALLEDNGRLAFLLRVNFLEGKERQRGLWREHPPEYIYVLDRRPTFKTTTKPKLDKVTRQPMLNKRTSEPLMVTTKNDSCAYGVFVWAKASAFEPVIRFLQW